MSEEKQDKLINQLKNYNKEREALLQIAIEKKAKGEELTEEEKKAIIQHFPDDEELKRINETMSGFSKTLEGIIQPEMDIVNTISKNIDEITTPFSKAMGKGLQKALQPVFDELENQNKENPLTRKEIEEGSKFFDEYIKEKTNLTQEMEMLNLKQQKLLSNIFNKTGATEEEIVNYKLESEEVDLPSNIFKDISRKLQGKETIRKEIEGQVKKHFNSNLSKKTQEKIKNIKPFTEEELRRNLTNYEIKNLEKAIKEIEEETLLFNKRPSRMGNEEIERQDPFKYIINKSIEIHFENISEEDFKSYLQEEIEIYKKAISIRNTINSRNREILRIFSRASNPYFEGKKEDELSEEDRQFKEDFYNTSFLLFQNSTNLEKLFSNIFLKRTPFEQLEIERQESFFEFLKYSLEELEDLQKEWTQKNEVTEIVEPFLVTSENDRKVLTTEKIVPQLMLSGKKIEEKFLQLKEGEVEKVIFDISSDNEKKYFIEVLMKEFPLTFTEDTFKTLESLMTIQYLMEKQYNRNWNVKFTTKDIIKLNKGGRVTNYSKDLIQKTNREIISLMSAIGSLDTTEYFFKYYEIDEETIVEENKAIFKNINTNEEWEKKINELRKEKIKKEKINFPFDKITKISTIQPFVSLKGLNIESEEEAYNNTEWKFNDTDGKPIPLFEFLRITKRYSLLPLEMDSYLTEGTLNNEVTRSLKTIIANLNYYKNNKQMKKDKTKKNFLEYYFEGTKEGEKEEDIFEPFEAMQLRKKKELVGSWKYKITRTIDSIAKDCKFDEEREIGVPKIWKDKERPRFVGAIVDYLRKAKENKNIDDFILYTTKDKIVKNEEYITEQDKRQQKTKDKIRGKTSKPKKKNNEIIEKISIIIK